LTIQTMIAKRTNHEKNSVVNNTVHAHKRSYKSYIDNVIDQLRRTSVKSKGILLHSLLEKIIKLNKNRETKIIKKFCSESIFKTIRLAKKPLNEPKISLK